MQRGETHLNLNRASQLIGRPVRNPAGEDLGTLEDLMLDGERGCVAYAVLSFGGFLGMGTKLLAVPWEALSLRPDGEALLLAVDKGLLAHAPGFDQDNWPGNAHSKWCHEVHRHYGFKPYWET